MQLQKKLLGRKDDLFIDDNCDVRDKTTSSSFIFAAILRPMFTEKFVEGFGNSLWGMNNATKSLQSSRKVTTFAFL